MNNPMNCTFPACRCEMPATCTLEKTMEALNTGALRKVAEAATPGPWRWWVTVSGARIAGRPTDGSTNFVCDVLLPERAVSYESNARHIAAFNPETAIALLDRIAALEAENAKLWYLIDELRAHEGAEGWSEYLRDALNDAYEARDNAKTPDWMKT